MAELHRAVVKSMGEERTSEDSCLSSEVQSQSVQVGDLKVLSDNDTNFDHLQLAGEKRTSEDSCLSSEVQSQESQIVRVGDLEVLSDNDTNFDHLQLAVEILGPGPGHKKRDGAKYLAMMEMLRVDTIIGRDVKWSYVGNNLTTPKVQDVMRTSQARQSWSQETKKISRISWTLGTIP
jgi:hypothetical protein